MKRLIINETDLSNEDIGKILDHFETEYVDTIYYGLEEFMLLEYKGKEIKIYIKYLKRYVKIKFFT